MIALAKDGPVWTVTLNRPDKANALTVEMLETLGQIFAQAAEDCGLKALIVTGAGERVFCSGADLAEARDATSITTNPIWETMSTRLANLPCLTIAALNGTLAGGGFAIALACDMRIATPKAIFFYPVLKNGFLPQPSDVKRMNALIGPSRTKLILLAGQKLTADTALSIGLIDRIVEPAAFAETLTDLTLAAVAAPGHTLTAIKRLCQPDVSKALRDDCFRVVYDDDADARARLRRHHQV